MQSSVKTSPWQRQLFLETHKPSTCIKYFSEIENEAKNLGPANYEIVSFTETLKATKNIHKGQFSQLPRFKFESKETNFRPSSIVHRTRTTLKRTVRNRTRVRFFAEDFRRFFVFFYDFQRRIVL